MFKALAVGILFFGFSKVPFITTRVYTKAPYEFDVP